MGFPFPSANTPPVICTAGALTSAALPHEVVVLAEALEKRHGRVTAARESSGLHLYMASPAGLERDGSKELTKRHLAINVDRYFGHGKFRNRFGSYDQDLSGLCMKTGKAYRVTDLLRMAPLAQRGIIEPQRAAQPLQVKERRLVSDGFGHMIPESPGACTPVTALPPEHPARFYLESRHYDVVKLWDQFRCSYCTTELPEDPAAQRWYRKMPGNFKDSPTGRIVFFADILGVQQCWQARTIDIKDDQYHWYWHGTTNQWVAVEQKTSEGWVLLPAFQPAQNRVWSPSKYLTAKGSARNEIIMGFDAALRWNTRTRPGKARVGILSEGPLDAGRFGPPGMAMIGKFLSENQAKLLANHFDKIIYVRDNDAAGISAAERVHAVLGQFKPVADAIVPAQYKDVGEIMDEAAAWALVEPFL